MTLPYRQERLLRRAERTLRRSDPDLASMLSIFARLATAEQLPAQEQLRPRPTWAQRVLQWRVAAGGRSGGATGRGAASGRSADENRETR